MKKSSSFEMNRVHAPGGSRVEKRTAQKGRAGKATELSPARNAVTEKPARLLPEYCPPRERVLVRLGFYRPQAHKLLAAGTFNDWHSNATPLAPVREGEWAVDLMLKPGRYEYRYLVDGQWMDDPMAPRFAANPFGGLNSVMRRGCRHEARSRRNQRDDLSEAPNDSEHPKASSLDCNGRTEVMNGTFQKQCNPSESGKKLVGRRAVSGNSAVTSVKAVFAKLRPTRTFGHFALAIMLAAWLVPMIEGCATTTTPGANPDLLNFLRLEHTTREEVLLKLGQPSGSFEQERIFTYRLGQDSEQGYYLISPKQLRPWQSVRYSLVLVFDAGGVLQKQSLVSVQ